MRKIAPSLVSADLGHLEDALSELEACGADAIHLDVEDGVFVPNLTFGFPVLKAVRPLTHLPVEVHLMMANPEPYLARFASLGADSIFVHFEALPYPRRVLGAIRQLGLRAGLALNPRTPVEQTSYLLDLMDGLLLMCTEPDGMGERFIPGSLERIRQARAMAPNLDVVADGGITQDLAPAVWEAGATTIVVGRALFGAKDLAQAIRLFRGDSLEG